MDAWLEEQNKILNINKNYKRESLKYINLHFCYVDSNNSIVKLKTEKHMFGGDNNQMLSETAILNIIENNKKNSNMHFAFSELSLFHVDLEPENIKSFDTNKTNFFKTLPFVSDVSFSDSVFIFHPLNCLFFLFKQKSNLKSISSSSCSNNSNNNNNNKLTKKVAFSKKKHTRRII
jgi:hypothetical protein